MSDELRVRMAVKALLDQRSRTRASRFPEGVSGLDRPGLYAWFADPAGARNLSQGLELRLPGGLIYAGQAGAGRSIATLGGRIRGDHLRGNVYGSTFRYTLASSLRVSLGLEPTGGRTMSPESELSLTTWMLDHLAVAVYPFDDRLALARFEDDVLATLDPALNLGGMAPSPVRSRLSSLRSEFAQGGHQSIRPSTRGPATPVPSQRRVPVTRRPETTSLQLGPTPNAVALLKSLIGEPVPTLTQGKANRILEVADTRFLAATEASPAGAWERIAIIQDAIDRLFRDGELMVTKASLGHWRTALVGAVLAQIPGVVVLSTNPRRLGLRP